MSVTKLLASSAPASRLGPFLTGQRTEASHFRNVTKLNWFVKCIINCIVKYFVVKCINKILQNKFRISTLTKVSVLRTLPQTHWFSVIFNHNFVKLGQTDEGIFFWPVWSVCGLLRHAELSNYCVGSFNLLFFYIQIIVYVNMLFIITRGNKVGPFISGLTTKIKPTNYFD